MARPRPELEFNHYAGVLTASVTQATTDNQHYNWTETVNML